MIFIRFWHGSNVIKTKIKTGLVVDALTRLAIDHSDRGAEYVVIIDHFRQSALDSVWLELVINVTGDRQWVVIGFIVFEELIQCPNALLRIGERKYFAFWFRC